MITIKQFFQLLREAKQADCPCCQLVVSKETKRSPEAPVAPCQEASQP
ncbi:hypothetical protein SAMN06296036_103280 [Pseudobacteriovorax antillogorgiicola]|uniref:Uncharacterized protein n=1 Tax=Pseudobacteriovorax antillogorgiicola TaxID=1513793 RepID=A0A1Y6BCE1_9BACT|nr:hypothetical protein EDD56_10353 [Pseudobacteriovorax antillogorgiicola]SMF02634.1 hypothetical protein SAMN06296036_103280 [Pseudobacteriovorax antillogorgiicola]